MRASELGAFDCSIYSSASSLANPTPPCVSDVLIGSFGAPTWSSYPRRKFVLTLVRRASSTTRLSVVRSARCRDASVTHRLVVLLTVVATASSSPGQAQPSPANGATRLFVANAAIGGVVGAVRAAIHGRSLRRGAITGAAGGGIAAAARRVVGGQRPFHGALGRAGHSVALGVGNLAARDSLEIPIDIGALTVRWRVRAPGRSSFVLNATALLNAGVALSQPRSRVDWSASVWSAGLVVAQREAQAASAVPGVIRIPDRRDRTAYVTPIARRRDLSHELIHELQFRALHEWIGREPERKMLATFSIGRALRRHMDVGALGPAVAALLTSPLRYAQNPFEIEAWWLANERRPVAP